MPAPVSSARPHPSAVHARTRQQCMPAPVSSACPHPSAVHACFNSGCVSRWVPWQVLTQYEHTSDGTGPPSEAPAGPSGAGRFGSRAISHHDEVVTFYRRPAAADASEPSVRLLLGEVRSDGPATRGCRDYYCCHQDCLRALALSDGLSNVATLLVVMNVVLMCMPYEGMPDSYASRLEDGTLLISCAFIVEMALKMAGLGWQGYWSDNWNVLDGTIVLLSVFELILTLLVAGHEGYNLSFLRMMRMLRLLRVLRMLRLMRKWRGLYRIVSTFIRAMPQMSNIFLLILLTMFIFALLGMQVRPPALSCAWRTRGGGVRRSDTGRSCAGDHSRRHAMVVWCVAWALGRSRHASVALLALHGGAVVAPRVALRSSSAPSSRRRRATRARHAWAVSARMVLTSQRSRTATSTTWGPP